VRGNKIIAALLCLALVFGSVGCGTPQEEPPKDFRESRWGDSRSRVEKAEDTEYIFATDDLLLFQTMLDDEPVEVYYVFEDDALTEAQIKFVIGERILNDLIASYEALRASLTDRYGEPVDPEYRVWIDRDPDRENNADNMLLYEHLMRYETVWRTETSEYKLTLEYIDLQIDYILHAQPIAAETE